MSYILNIYVKYLLGQVNVWHIVNLSICAPSFTSSDWSTHVFAIRNVTNVI